MLVAFALVTAIFLALFAIVTAAGTRPATLAALRAVPAQLRGLARRRVRRNLLLAQATLNVLEERLGPLPLAALAEEDGFVVLGGLPPEVVAEAATEALDRLRLGERPLALVSRSVTWMVLGQLVAAILVVVALALLGALAGLPLLAGLLVAALVGPRLGPLLQRVALLRLGTGALAVEGATRRPPSGRLGLLSSLVLGPVVVRTGEGVESWDDADRDAARGQVTLITGDRAEIAAGRYRVGPPR